jgi:dTDP-4-dehydrorhamnose reductase
MSKTKVLLVGSSGLVGSRFVEMVKDFDLITPDSQQLNLTDLNSVQKFLDNENPDWVINFAAFTDVNAAEEQTGDMDGLAWKINVGGVENLLSAFKSKNIIQISTDMVFPGDLSKPGPYNEDDTPPNTNEKLTWYGWTKNRAESLIQERGGTILRIIYPVRSNFDKKLDYIRGALKKYADGKMYPLFNDQQIAISYIDEVSEALKKIIESDSHGVFHAASDTTTPYDLICRVVDQLGEDSSSIQSASIHDFLKNQKNPNRYPVYGGLKTHETEEKLDIHFSSWQTVIDFLIGQGLRLPSKSGLR